MKDVNYKGFRLNGASEGYFATLGKSDLYLFTTGEVLDWAEALKRNGNWAYHHVYFKAKDQLFKIIDQITETFPEYMV